MNQLSKSSEFGDYEITSRNKVDNSFEGRRKGEKKTWILRKQTAIEPSFQNINCVYFSEIITNNLGEKFIVSEKCDYTLELYMLQRKQFWFTAEQVYEIASQILNGIKHLTKMNQLKNPLLRPSCIQIKLIGDLEIIKIDNYLLSQQKQDQWNHYSAPEEWNEKLQGTQEQILIYQFGIILYQLCFNNYPQEVSTLNKFHQQIEKQPFRCPKIEKQSWQPLINLIEKMIVFKADDRITFNELSADSRLQPRFAMVGHYLIDLKKKIGSGMQGTIYTAMDLDTEVQCCAKVVDNQMLEAQKEIEIYKNFNKSNQHPNVINVLNIQDQEQQTFIILELGDENLEQFCQKKKLNDETIFSFLSQIVDGYIHLKEQNIIHRDLKPQNILIKYVNNQPVLKIIDFGVGKIMGGQKLTQTLAGTPLYSAPEVLLGLNYSDQCDIFSLGVMLHQIVFGKLHYNPQSFEELIAYVNSLKIKPFKCDPQKQINQYFQILIENMLVFEVNHRLTWEDIKDITKTLSPLFQMQHQKEIFFKRENRTSFLKSNDANLDLKFLDSTQIFLSKVEQNLSEYINSGQQKEFINDLKNLMIFVLYCSYGVFNDLFDLFEKGSSLINNVAFFVNLEKDLGIIKKANLLIQFEIIIEQLAQVQTLNLSPHVEKILDTIRKLEQQQRITIWDTQLYYFQFYQSLKKEKQNQLAILPLKLRFYLEKLVNLFLDYPLEQKHQINYSELQCKILSDGVCNNYLIKHSVIIKKQ